MSKSEIDYFEEMKANMSEHDAPLALYQLSGYLYRYYGKKVIILLDEYDTPMQEAYVGGFWDELVSFTRSLFNSTFKTNPWLERGIMTGITRVSKESIFSDLNNLEVVTTTSDKYATYFGFTEEHVAKIVKLPQCKLTHQELKEWYEGYKLNGKDIYNPNSVVSAISDGICQSYWSGTSSNEEVVNLINMNFDGIKDDIIHLIEGSTIQFSCTTFQNDMVSIKTKDDIFSLLVCLGYLGCVDDGGDYRLAYVPNKEIRTALSSIVKSQPWFNSIPIIERSQSLFEAITTLDANKAAEIITEIHNSPNVSLLTYNREESMVFCLISGLMWQTEREYEVFRELQSGKGSADLIYVPKRNMHLPILLIEFKYGQSAEEALNQIKEKLKKLYYLIRMIYTMFQKIYILLE